MEAGGYDRLSQDMHTRTSSPFNTTVARNPLISSSAHALSLLISDSLLACVVLSRWQATGTLRHKYVEPRHLAKQYTCIAWHRPTAKVTHVIMARLPWALTSMQVKRRGDLALGTPGNFALGYEATAVCCSRDGAKVHACCVCP